MAGKSLGKHGEIDKEHLLSALARPLPLMLDGTAFGTDAPTKEPPYGSMSSLYSH